MVSHNGYLPRGSKGNALSFTTIGNVSVARQVIPLVTRSFLDFVMIHLNSVKFIWEKQE